MDRGVDVNDIPLPGEAINPYYALDCRRTLFGTPSTTGGVEQRAGPSFSAGGGHNAAVNGSSAVGAGPSFRQVVAG